MRPATLVIGLMVFLAGCSGGPDGSQSLPPGEGTPPVADAGGAVTDPLLTEGGVRFIAIGDTGTGEAEQIKVAGALKEVCADLGCDFVIGLGDNIYEAGVTSHYDPQFDAKFEVPYQDLDLPFYMTLGNHDNGAAVTVEGIGYTYTLGDFQVMYGERMDRASEKWVMPARWYSHEQGPVQFIAIDSNLMGGDPSAAPWDPAGQQEWLNATLGAPTDAAWRIVYGHHPYISNGDHGDATGPRKQVYEASICDRADLFLAGHDHDLQWLKPVDQCGKTHFIVSGAGAKQRALVDEDRNDAHFQRGNTHGFFWFHIAGDQLEGRVFDAEAKELFSHNLTRG